MPRPESPLRDGDIVKITMQKRPKEKPYWSVVARLFDDDSNEHLHMGLVDNPSQWARWNRHNVDNPPVEVIE